MYPFGLQHKGYNNIVSSNANSVASKFKYNGIEFEEALGMNLYEMDLRQYDPAIARWTGIDPVTHFSMSTYTAFDNNPVFWADPSGADGEHYNWDTGRYEDDKGNEVSFGAALASVGLNADGSEQTDPTDPKKKKKAKKKAVKDMSAGEFYGMAYNGASRTAYLNGNDPYNPTDADIAENEKNKQDAAGELFLFLTGEWAVARIFQGGKWVYRYTLGKRTVSTIQKANPFDFIPTQYITRSRKQFELLVKDIKLNGITEPIEYAVKNGVKYIQNGHHRAYIAKRLGIKVPIKEVPYKAGMEFVEQGKNPGYLKHIKW